MNPRTKGKCIYDVIYDQTYFNQKLNFFDFLTLTFIGLFNKTERIFLAFEFSISPYSILRSISGYLLAFLNTIFVPALFVCVLCVRDIERELRARERV